MLGTAENVEAVAKAVADHGIRVLVVDPVFAAGGGSSLADQGFLEVLTELLLPRAALITPNAREASALARLPVKNA